MQETGTFLVDSQGDICVIKQNALVDGIAVDTADISTIRGVSAEPIITYGSVMVDMYFDDLVVTHKFHVVPNNFAIPTDGLIGRDFMRLYKCKLDYADSENGI